MFKSLFGDKHETDGKILIDQRELSDLREKAAEFDRLSSNQSKNIAQQITDTALAVNRATQQRLESIQNSYQMVRGFIEQSRSVEGISQSSFESASETSSTSEDCIEQLDKLVTNIRSSAQFISEFTALLANLDENSKNIDHLVESIKGIAEQTNLLALNAAIEAARAGEHGRGFAVVADEVRTLAQRTQNSTQEIDDMIKKLQASTIDAVAVMEQSQSQAKSSVTEAQNTGQALELIADSVNQISDMITQIATATEQQHHVAEDISSNIVHISSVANDVAEDAKQLADSSDVNQNLVNKLVSAVNMFKY